MNPGRWHQVDELFEAALEKTGEDREAFLAGLDAELRAELERLLAADGAARTFLERSSWLAATYVPAPPGDATQRSILVKAGGADLPKRIGPYKVLGVLGEGGMGRVLLASRADEQYQRLVAIKTLRSQLLNGGRPGGGREETPKERRLREELLARFDLERQALAQLEHPNIARLYDAGRDDRGDPYLVLEHIDGVPLDVYCDQKSLDVATRLRLFLEVCQAVSAAHRNLLVHRDLKPSNILVTPEGRPMLLDFGIAKLLDPGRIAGELLETREGSRPMTPGYASPEQVKGEPITTASDVYSLGVLLYELLTGRKPYRVTSWQPHELERAICEVEPEKPSTAVFRQTSGEGRTAAGAALGPDEVARRRGTSPSALARHLRGDLDTLLHKALRKDPDQRYVSVEALGQDIEAYLEGRPLAARPPSAFYALRKFARRHRFAAAAAGALAALLVVFLAALALKAKEIQAERDKAQQALAFLIEVFKASEPDRAQGEDLTAREVLDGAARRIESELEGQPEIQATLMDAMGEIYLSLGLYREAEALFARSLDLRRTLAAPAATTLGSRLGRGRARLYLGDFAAAQTDFEAAIADQADGVDLATARLGLGDALHTLGHANAAIGQKQQAVALLENLLAAAPPGAGSSDLESQLADAEVSLADSLSHQLPVAGPAEPLYAKAEKRRRRLFGDRSRETAALLFRRGDLAAAESRYTDAIPLLVEAIAVQRQLLDAEHPDLLDSLEKLAVCHTYVGQAAASLPLYGEVLEKRRRRLGPRHPLVATTLTMLGTNLYVLDDFAGALQAFEEALSIRQEVYRGHPHRDVANALCNRADALRELGRLDEAERDCGEALAIQQTLESSEAEVERGYLCRGRVELARADYPAAENSLRRAYESRRQRLPPGVDARVNAEIAYACAIAGLGRHTEAEALLRGAYARIFERNPKSSRLGGALECLAPVARALGRDDAAQIQLFLDHSDLRAPLASP